MKKVLHLIPNAHIDPVWLWDYREGLNEGIATCIAVLDLMDEFPQLTFIRGETSIYEHVEKYAPDVFARIKAMIKAKRWDIVGGNYVQPDTNIPDTSSFLTQYEIGQNYFLKKFGRKAEVAWAADSFGHSSNLPEIYNFSGFKYFAYSRPQEHLQVLPSPLFHWTSLGGNAVLSYRVENGCYQIERNNAIETLDKALEYVGKSPLQHHCAFIGLGNHGGGASRRHILEATQWAKQHPEIICKFSTLTEFFHLAEKEKNIPVFKGELNFSLRGCHSSAAVIKHKYREMEKTVKRARAIAPAADWEAINKGLSFNAFHDIIPGSSIDRANREQVTWMDNVIHAAREIEFDALNQRANAVTVQVEPGKGDNPCAVPYYLYNSSPFEFNGIVEIETCIDYRPRFDYTNRGDELPLELLDGGKAAAFQVLQTEHSAFEEFPWRRRVAFNTTIPPMSGKIVTLGYKEKPRTAKSPKWQNNCTVLVKNKKLLINGQAVEVATYNDKYGSWGDMNEGVEGYTCPEKFETWKITNVIEKFDGAILKECFVEFKGGRSTLMLRLRRYFDKNEVELNGTILWQERNVRLRLTVPGSKKISYQNPGGEITRSLEGDVPGGRYADLNDGRVICSDNISGFTVLGSKLHINLIRGSICASSRLDQGDLTRSLTDLGRHEFKLLFTDDKRRAEDMLYDVAQVMTFVHNGNKQKISKTEISSKNVRLLEVNPGSIIVQLQNSKDETVKINGKNVKLKAWQITRLKV